jgi:hypothetical protein
MAVDFRIVDGEGSGVEAHVTPGHEVLVSQSGCPPLRNQKCIVFGQDITDDGLTTGSDDLGINGAATPTLFWVPADPDKDRYITRLSFIVGYGASARLYDFADSGGALVNGVRIYYENFEGREVTIGNPTRNYSFLRLAIADGIVPTAWELRNLGALNDYGYLISIDLTRIMPPYGVKLDRGTTERLLVHIRDDCTDADTFNCRAFGFERIE